jgi:hypothetical protein
MTEWIPAILTIVVNIIAIAFFFGKLSQNVGDLKERMGLADEASVRKNNKEDAWKDKVESMQKIHDMLPDCVEAFGGIRRELSDLSGKVDTLIKIARN